MKKPIIIVIVLVALTAIVGAGLFISNRKDDSLSTNNSSAADVMQKVEGESVQSMEKAEEAMVKADDSATAKEEPVMEKTESEAMVKSSTYVTLADFNKDPSIYTSQKKVYFFHASWCPICKSIDEDITSDPSQIPSGTTFIKTDYDDNTELRQKYGVTYQYTFVQVDNDGNEVKQWSATTLDKAIAGIQ